LAGVQVQRDDFLGAFKDFAGQKAEDLQLVFQLRLGGTGKLFWKRKHIYSFVRIKMLAKRSAKSRKPELAAFCKVGSVLNSSSWTFYDATQYEYSSGDSS
ncbi:MAG: hypothetical protein RSF79_25260, partial [Janthinobacterium sp.]